MFQNKIVEYWFFPIEKFDDAKSYANKLRARKPPVYNEKRLKEKPIPPLTEEALEEDNESFSEDDYETVETDNGDESQSDIECNQENVYEVNVATNSFEAEEEVKDSLPTVLLDESDERAIDSWFPDLNHINFGEITVVTQPSNESTIPTVEESLECNATDTNESSLAITDENISQTSEIPDQLPTASILNESDIISKNISNGGGMLFVKARKFEI